MIRLTTIISLAGAVVVLVTGARAEIHMHRDRDGVLHFSDAPFAQTPKVRSTPPRARVAPIAAQCWVTKNQEPVRTAQALAIAAGVVPRDIECTVLDGTRVIVRPEIPTVPGYVFISVLTGSPLRSCEGLIRKSAVQCALPGKTEQRSELERIPSTGEQQGDSALISAADLYRAYQVNPLAADAVYKDELVLLGGVVKSIGRELLGRPYLEFAVGDVPMGVQAVFDDPDETPKLAQLLPGDVVNAACVGRGNMPLGVVVLDHCFLAATKRGGGEFEYYSPPSTPTPQNTPGSLWDRLDSLW